MSATAGRLWTTPDSGDCPVADTLKSIGGKHTPKILHCLAMQDHHFLEMTRALPGISRKVLTEELRHLEAIGLVTRTELLDARQRVLYALSGKGRELAAILGEIFAWAMKHSGSETDTGNVRSDRILSPAAS